MKYNFDEIIDRRGTDCLKYDFGPKRKGRSDLLPMWVADMDFKLPDEILADLHKRVDHGIFGYTDPLDDYFEARLVPGGEASHLTVTLEVTPRNGRKTAAEAMQGLPDVEIALYVERRGRMALFHNKENILIPREEMQALLH